VTGATIAETVGRTLAALGCRQVFGVIGSGNFVVTRALVDAGAGFVAARHETAAVTMADAWARVTGEVGVATVHQGPGFTNALTGLAEAAKSRTPLLVLAGDTSAAAVRSNFRVDQAAMAVAVGAVPERLHTPASAVADVVRAHRRAVLERRTVALMLPLDVQAAPTDPAAAAFVVPPLGLLTRTQPSADAVDAVANLLAAARFPAIVAGRGAVLADARGPLEDLAELTGAVLATSAVANGLFAGNPFAAGISGGFASPVAARLLAQADLVVAAGASLNMWTTRHGGLIGPHAKVLQIDTEVDAIGAHRPVDLGIVGDVAATAEALVAALRRREHANPGFHTDETAVAIAAGGWRQQPLAAAAAGGAPWPAGAQGAVSTGGQDAVTAGGHDPPPGEPTDHRAETGATGKGGGTGAPASPGGEASEASAVDDGVHRSDDTGTDEGLGAAAARAAGRGEGGRIDPRVLSIRLHEMLPAERLLAIDSGHFMGWPAMYIDVPDPQAFVFTQAYQSIGLGLASAIGAALARPDRLTVAAVGDGGALMAAGELETLGRLGLPMLVVVYNDDAYGAEVHHFGPQGEPLDIVRFPDTDFAALGRAAGTEAVTVRHVDDLAAVEQWIARWTAHTPTSNPTDPGPAASTPLGPASTATASTTIGPAATGTTREPPATGAAGAPRPLVVDARTTTDPPATPDAGTTFGRTAIGTAGATSDPTATGEAGTTTDPAATGVATAPDVTAEPGATGEAGVLRPLVVDAKVDPTVVAEWLSEAFRAH
jgi:thiamine pyrophosphate-dependent acetolactate synthase large subunit-like protein